MAKEKAQKEPIELKAVSAIYSVLKPLDRPVQIRAIRYAAEMLGLDLSASLGRSSLSEDPDTIVDDPALATSTPSLPAKGSSEEVEGINAVALKWIKRSGLNSKNLSTLFSLGIDEIDLVAKSVPGQSKRGRMRNVILLKGIAAYLGSGAARITYEQMKEACLHYNAFDNTNSATYLKSFAAEVAGTREAGFTLTPRGLSAATDLIREMVESKT